MDGTWYGLTPAMSLEQAIDGVLFHFMSNSGSESLLDLACCDKFAFLGTAEKGSQKGLFFLPREMLVASAPFAWRLDCSSPEAVVGRNHLADHHYSCSRMPGNLSCRAWLNESIIDDLYCRGGPPYHCCHVERLGYRSSPATGRLH